jgi:hypothetical protein
VANSARLSRVWDGSKVCFETIIDLMHNTTFLSLLQRLRSFLGPQFSWVEGELIDGRYSSWGTSSRKG